VARPLAATRKARPKPGRGAGSQFIRRHADAVTPDALTADLEPVAVDHGGLSDDLRFSRGEDDGN